MRHGERSPDPKPVWLWWSRTGAAPAGVNRCWQAFLRHFDLEHTFRLFKQVLGWTAPKIRDPRPAGPAEPGPGPPGIPEHPRDLALSDRCAETWQARPRPPARIKELPPGIPPRRGQNDEEGVHAQGAPRPRRLNDKLRMSATIVALMARKVVYGMTSVAPVDPCAGSTRPQSLASASGLR
jgi:hypothetical protein